MDSFTAQERAREASPSTRLRSTGAPGRARPALVEPELPDWRETVTRLAEESNDRERRLRRALALADVAALAIALLASVPVVSPNLEPATLLLLPAVVAVAKMLGLYESDEQRIRKTTAEELPRLAQLGALLILSVWLAGDWLIEGVVQREQAIAVGLVFVLGAILGRRAARAQTNRNLPRERCLFIGDENSYLRLRAIFDRHALPADLIDRVAINDAMVDGRPDVPGQPQALMELIARANAHRVIIGPHGLSNDMTFELLETAREGGTRVSLLPDMLEVVGSSVDFDDLYGITLLGVRHTHLSRSSRALKRAFDLAGATIILALAAPAMAIIAIAIMRDSSGPVLFRQWRIGRDGAPFRIFKFRTMADGADELKDGLRALNEADGLFKIQDDPRMTRVGRRLRRVSLDELPQIFNVLLGQMSLVGPRPLVADEHDAALDLEQRRRRAHGVHRGRLRLTPGMTGQWQISGSARVPLEHMVKLDHLYVSNWTVWGDVKILLRTVPYVLSRRGL